MKTILCIGKIGPAFRNTVTVEEQQLQGCRIEGGEIVEIVATEVVEIPWEVFNQDNGEVEL